VPTVGNPTPHFYKNKTPDAMNMDFFQEKDHLDTKDGGLKTRKKKMKSGEGARESHFSRIIPGGSSRVAAETWQEGEGKEERKERLAREKGKGIGGPAPGSERKEEERRQRPRRQGSIGRQPTKSQEQSYRMAVRHAKGWRPKKE